ncbi:MAG: hypothetical protein CUR34_11415 [Sediminibacterium sp.]|nr:MAG: hypothetical protein CUR34_11415 [Sediminibacterium sp.] [Sediminibacterium sp. FEMGT703S]
MRNVIVLIFLLKTSVCSAQRDSVEMSNFLNFFVKDYQATQGVSKINNKVRPQTFSKTNLSYTNWYSIVLKNDTTVFKKEQDKKNFFAKLYENAVELNFAKYISDTFLVDIDCFYAYDSLHVQYLNAIKKIFPNYQLLINQNRLNEIPDSVLKISKEYEKLSNDFFNKRRELAKSMIEITTPYFFEDYNKCVIVSYIHNYSRQNSKLYYFKKSHDKWELQKLLFPDFNIDY